MKRHKIISLIILLLLSMVGLWGQTFGKNKVQPQKTEWSKLETIHFDIYYPKGEDFFGKTCALMAEDAYYYLKQNFRIPIYGRIPVLFYRSHREFSTTNIIYPLLTEGTGGFTEYAKNRVVVPFHGSFLKLEEVLIHELTHAYVNAVKHKSFQRGVFGLSKRNLPFWFSEGLPEFLSINGKDPRNNMFVIDLILNDNFPLLNEINGYYAYRLGESYLNYLGEKYGKNKVMDYFYAVRIAKNMDDASKKVFGYEFEALQHRWKTYLKRKYSNLIMDFRLPYEIGEQITDHIKSQSYMNIAPRYSPNGEHYVYYGTKNMRSTIFLGDVLDYENKQEVLLVGEKDPRFEEFHFERANLAWFPDNKRVAFVAKTSTKDQLYIMNIVTKKIEQIIPFPMFDGVYEIDIDLTGNKLVFSAQKNSQNDLYYYDLKTQEVVQLTNDYYYDAQPKWSPDGTTIAFCSERHQTVQDTTHIFYDLEKSIFLYDFTSKDIRQVTFEKSNEMQPVWMKDGKSILYISDESSIHNVHILDLEKQEKATVTKVLSGVTGFDMVQHEYLMTSIFFDRGWDLYLITDPLENLIWEKYQAPRKIQHTDFATTFNIDRYQYYGYRKRDFKSQFSRDKSFRNFKYLTPKEFAKRESIMVETNRKLDAEPTEIKIPKKSDYKPLSNFSIDHLWGGMGYSAAVGTVGELQVSMSDLMGNHALGIQTSFRGKFEETDFVLSYLYLTGKIDYGFGAFQLTNDTIYRISRVGDDDFLKDEDKELGVYSLVRYPFNKFWRIDFENSVTHEKSQWYLWNSDKNEWDKYDEDYYFLSSDLAVNTAKGDPSVIYAPSISLVHDNTIYSSTGPISGWRAMLLYRQGFAEKQRQYNLTYFDYRQYFLFAKRFSFASRLVGGYSGGENPRVFQIDGLNGVRGFDDDEVQGYKKAVVNLELRYPFIDRLQIPFPVPLALGNIRGAAFLDLGATWKNNDEWNPADNGELQDLKLGFGFGPRLNLGFLIVQFDVAWNSTLMSASKPSYYFYLKPEF